MLSKNLTYHSTTSSTYITSIKHTNKTPNPPHAERIIKQDHELIPFPNIQTAQHVIYRPTLIEETKLTT